MSLHIVRRRPLLPRVVLPAVAVAGLLAGCGDDPGSSPGAASSEPSAALSERATAPSTRDAEGRSSDAPAAGATLSITVSGDEVSPMAESISMSTGDVLTIRVTSDRPGELHVHATPEQYVEFGAGETRRELTFDTPGQVDVEEHETGAVVARLLVR